MSQNYLSSTDFARAVGVSVPTIQRWDIEGRLIPVKRTISGRRLYSQEQLEAFLAEDYNNPLLKGKLSTGVSNSKAGDKDGSI